MDSGLYDWKLTNGTEWASIQSPAARSFTCGYCSFAVSSDRGWKVAASDAKRAAVRICPHCNGPSFFDDLQGQWPGPLPGDSVAGLDNDVASLYDEARRSVSAQSPTGSVLLCRKVLMHVAVDKGAETNLKFIEYVEWLVENHHAPAGAKPWLDYIRKRGNEATHEIMLMTHDDAEGVLRFTEALLRNVYELPSLVPEPPGEPA